jgi:multidrug resistance efflux pump
MRRLKARPQSQPLPNQARSHRQAIIRWVYLGSVIALLAWLGDLFFGSLFYLRSEGMVVAQPAVIAAEFPATVRDILVHEGQRVEKGEIAAVVSSQQVAENTARLTADLGVREARLSELRIRGQKVDAVIEIAMTRRDAAADTRKRFGAAHESGHLSIDKYAAAVESDFRGRQDVATLKAEKAVVEGEITTLRASLQTAEAAVNDLRRLYDDGRMRAPIGGIVGRVVAERGSVVRAGEPIIEIYGNQRYVLSYVPTGGLYEVSAGTPVVIKTGLRSIYGTVSRVEPFAAALPKEFQRAFVPVERLQVLRIQFGPGEEPPPLFAKVQIRAAHILPEWFRWF